MTPPQGPLGIERMCALVGVSRAGYYRHWRRVAPGRDQIELRDVLQRLALGHRHYGYRRLTARLRRDGWAVNHKRVLRLMRYGQSAVSAPARVRAGDDRLPP